MPKLIDIPGTGTVEFPDSMPDADISRAIRLHAPEPTAKGSPEWANWRNQRVKDLNDHALSPHAPEDKGFLHGLWDTVNPFKIVTAPGAGGGDQPGQGPIGKVIGGIVRAGVDQAGKAKGAFQSGDYLSAAGHGLAAAVPAFGPAAANIGDAIGDGKTGEALGQSVGLALTLAAPKVAGGAVRALEPAAPAAEAALRSGAETQYARVLNPTAKGNKIRTAEVVPELIDRGVKAWTLKGLQAQAKSHIDSVGQAIGDAWDNLPAGTKTDLEPVYNRLQGAIDDVHSVADANGKMIPKGPEAERAIGNITKLQQTLLDVAETDPATGKVQIPVDKIRSLRQYFDGIAAKAGRYNGKDLADQSAAEAHGMAADAIRGELAKDHPDIASLNKEFSFWKDVHQVVSDTVTRKEGQAPSISSRFAKGFGFVKAGPVGAEVMGRLTEAAQSPAWRTIDAGLRNRLADAISSGNRTAVDFWAEKIGQAGGAAAVSGREQQTPELAAAGTQ